uniref:Cytochrome b5 heme-binding domain-containing protein n=1 Tax=Grammatophora oceanica TaxID=210454 RepID=A0A7S1YLP1_9STRA|eukprot:CAMPEP_0194033108 /NCGR_PEP_ID=MMETSP0009_2-20130614/5898_1 /TAXON_ID=210454 /ORGANISM="Grammatophora oceanica, Strain CCMP 410" /LENGTH=507 /DNA_ID=CAMNT_0038673729 /DNA_START=52 /DNA_END=1575 /DNA_ORIENTATION=+
MRILGTTILLWMATATVGFRAPGASSPSASRMKKGTKSRRYATTLEPPTKVNGDATKEAVGWDCDDEANCVQVDPCNEESCRTSLDVRIHGEWYDLSGWRKAHPAGEHWIDYYDGRDATEVMDGFHSAKGRMMYKRLPKSSTEVASQLEQTTQPDTSIQVAFRKLRQELEDEGWWERDILHESKLIGIWISLVVGAAATAHTAPPLAAFLLSLAFTNGGWLGHDYVHGVDEFADKFRPFGAVCVGLAATWWSDKHNKHHALTNEMGVDEDISTDPFLYQWPPAPENDSPLRKIQHLIFYIPFSMLFAVWRVDTLTVAVDAIEKKRPDAKNELYQLLGHYFVLFTVFPPNVWVPAIFLSGLMSALIVTPTHQSEELFEDYQPDWVTAQFQSTRNAVMTNPFSEWLWGGMQYQLEHHLFPSMPRSKYPALRERLIKFAEETGVAGGYRESGEFEILKMNWDLYKKVAEADPIPGSPATKGREGQQGAIRTTQSPANQMAAKKARSKMTV